MICLGLGLSVFFCLGCLWPAPKSSALIVPRLAPIPLRTTKVSCPAQFPLLYEQTTFQSHKAYPFGGVQSPVSQPPQRHPLLNPADRMHKMTCGPPSRPDSLASHQSLVPNRMPQCALLINDAYMSKELFNPTKGIPLEGPKTQLVNPHRPPVIESNPSQAHAITV